MVRTTKRRRELRCISIKRSIDREIWDELTANHNMSEIVTDFIRGFAGSKNITPTKQREVLQHLKRGIGIRYQAQMDTITAQRNEELRQINDQLELLQDQIEVLNK